MSILLLGSLYFYISSSPGFVNLVFVLLFILMNYEVGIRIGKENLINKRQFYLIGALSINIISLFIFKYLNFFSQSISNTGFYLETAQWKILAPAGISFIVFKTMSYLIDLYRREIQPENHVGKFFLYVLFFPQVMAGPIQRGGSLLPQFGNKIQMDYARLTEGLQWFLWGLFKKVVIADRLAIYVNQIYDHPETQTGTSLWVATYFYAFQIYCDFSGYTDMAIGCGRILGFRFPINFDRPYFAESISDFWRRWHITLSNWFRDYLYIPLGGNRVTKVRQSLNFLIVFLLCGLWHGAGWTFILWGGLHGFYLAFSSMTADVRREFSMALPLHERWSPVLRKIATFHLVCFAWIFFRANSLNDAFLMIKRIFFQRMNLDWLIAKSGEIDLWIVMLSLVFLLWIEFAQNNLSFVDFTLKRSLTFRWALFYVLIFSIVFLGVYGKQDFIYFQF
ncbi:MAG: MBOAT family O-acyltransferase [Nitrospiria bacterium]